MRKIAFYIIVLIISNSSLVKAQDTNCIVTRAEIVNGDTLPVVAMKEVIILSPLIFVDKMDALRFSKLATIVKSVYPYAKVVAVKANEYNSIINSAGSKKDKKRLMKQAEDELKASFEEDVKNMNDVQGTILIKLIDRETGSSSYDLIKSFRGSLVATFYQSFSRLYGYDLKSTYEPTGEDKDIEQIVMMIESGKL